MNRIIRALTVLTVAAATGLGTTACSSGVEGGGDASGTAAVTASEEMTTTTTISSTVPGPADTTVELPGAVADRWAELGGAEGELGPATGPAVDVDGGSIAQFERGALVLTPAGRVFVVQGEILQAYLAEDGPGGELGFPTADEASTDGGWISTFTGGVITYIDGVSEVTVN